MATLTPKLQLKKPVPNVETDWAFRLNESLDTLDDAILTANLYGADGIEIFDDGNGNPTISGNQNQIVTTSGGLQNSIDNNASAITANTGLIATTSGHLQSEIDAIDNSVTLQEAFDNGDGAIVTTSGKTFDINGPGGIVAVSGTFNTALRLPQYGGDPDAPTDGDVWINTVTSGIRWQVNSVKFEIQGTVV